MSEKNILQRLKCDVVNEQDSMHVLMYICSYEAEVPEDEKGILSFCCFRFLIGNSYVDLQARIVQPVSV